MLQKYSPDLSSWRTEARDCENRAAAFWPTTLIYGTRHANQDVFFCSSCAAHLWRCYRWSAYIVFWLVLFSLLWVGMCVFLFQDVDMNSSLFNQGCWKCLSLGSRSKEKFLWGICSRRGGCVWLAGRGWVAGSKVRVDSRGLHLWDKNLTAVNPWR